MQFCNVQLDFGFFQPKLIQAFSSTALQAISDQNCKNIMNTSIEMKNLQLFTPATQKYFSQNEMSLTSLNIFDEQIQNNQKGMKLNKDKKQKKNETKNIPKNYGKAIISFMLKSKRISNKILSNENRKHEQFYEFLRENSKRINSISDLRNLWINEKYGRVIRILSYYFMRKRSLSYIFKSRIKNYMTHIKYRQKIMEGIKNPHSFNNIKDY